RQSAASDRWTGILTSFGAFLEARTRMLTLEGQEELEALHSGNVKESPSASSAVPFNHPERAAPCVGKSRRRPSQGPRLVLQYCRDAEKKAGKSRVKNCPKGRDAMV